MAKSKFQHVKITGLSVIVPKKEICIYDEAQYYDNNIKKIERMHKIVGFNKRHVVEEGITASDLCIKASELLFKEMNIDIDSIDALIYVVQRPDHSSPATAYYIHNKLNLPISCIAFDIRQGCPGWVYGLNVAHSMIESGAYKKILLLAGDTPSIGVDPSDRNVAPVFGDGGSATLLEYSDKINESFFNISVYSDGYEAIIKPASGFRLQLHYDERDKELLNPIEKKSGGTNRLVDLYMDGLAVFDFTMNHVPENICDLMKYANISNQKVDYLMLHQANKQIIQTLSSKLGFSDEKAPWKSFEELGNQSITSIPVAIAYNISNELHNKQMKLLCSGFGNGLAVASALLNFNNVYCSGIKFYEAHKGYLSRQEYIEHWKEKIGNK